MLTIDGPTASGKGTLASAVAAALGYVLLDSGAVYRATAIAALQAGVDADDEPALEALARAMDLRFAGRPDLPRRRRRQRLASPRGGRRPRLADLGLAARAPAPCSACRPRFAACPAWSPTAATWAPSSSPTPALKVFLTASAAERAERRHKQLISKGISANIDSLRADLEARDARDINRSVSPLKPAEGAFLLDNSALTIEASVAAVLEAWEERRPFDRPQV